MPECKYENGAMADDGLLYCMAALVCERPHKGLECINIWKRGSSIILQALLAGMRTNNLYE